MLASPVSSLPSPVFPPASSSSCVAKRLPLALNIKLINEFLGILDLVNYAKVSRSWQCLSNQEVVWKCFANQLDLDEASQNKRSVIKLIVLCKQRVLEASQYVRPIERGAFCPIVLRNGFNAHLTLSGIGLSNLVEAEKIVRKFSPAKRKDPDLYVALGRGYLRIHEPQKAVEIVKLISGSGEFGPAPLYYNLVSYYVRRELMIEAFQLIMQIPKPVLDDGCSSMYFQSIVGIWFGKCEEIPTHTPLLLQIIRHLIKPENFHLQLYIKELITKHRDYGVTVEAILNTFEDYLTATNSPSIIRLFIAAGKLDIALEKAQNIRPERGSREKIDILKEIMGALRAGGKLEKAELLDRQIIKLKIDWTKEIIELRKEGKLSK